jgi:hypothetical protein
MTGLVVRAAVAALIGGSAIAAAQDRADQDKSQVFVNGALAVPGALPDAETVPSKYSAGNAASDKLPIAAFRLKHLTGEQRRQIYEQLAGERGRLALSPGGADDHYAIVGAEIPAEIALRDLTPVPETVTATFPELRGTAVLRSDARLLLVDSTNRIVVGVLTGQ